MEPSKTRLPASRWNKRSDPGRGMEEGTLAQAFEPFFTMKEEGSGSGLGSLWFTAAPCGRVEDADPNQYGEGTTR
jgi:hypothetical protein